MKKAIFLLTILSFFSCKKSVTLTHYQYKDIKVTRVDKGEKVFFSYGYFNDESTAVDSAGVVVDCSFDHFLFGFLLFHQNGSVEVISGGGGNYKMQKKGTMVFYDDKSSFNLDNFKSGNYNNLYQISDNLDLEQKRNNAFGSIVKIIK
nr:hypothetical protein [uncultured Mucilaginibacter sp.]